MMVCSCRTSPWRLFANSLARVHNLDPITSLPLRNRAAFRASARTFQVREIGTARTLRQEAVGATDFAAVPAEDSKPAAPLPIQEAKFHDTSKPTPRTKGKVDRDTKTKPTEPRRRPNKLSKTKSVSDEKSTPGTARRSQWSDLPIQAKPPPKESWKIQKAALKEKFPEGWKPRKRLSPDALAGIRALNAQFPDVYTTEALAARFEVSAEAIRRILKSKWQPATVDEEQNRQERWFRRGMSVWEHKAALGMKPPKRWRDAGVARDPSYHDWKEKKVQREKEWQEEEVNNYRKFLDNKRGRQSGTGDT